MTGNITIDTDPWSTGDEKGEPPPIILVDEDDPDNVITDLGDVPPGDYKVYDDKGDTGYTVTVDEGGEVTLTKPDGTVTDSIDYYTVSFVEDEGVYIPIDGEIHLPGRRVDITPYIRDDYILEIWHILPDGSTIVIDMDEGGFIWMPDGPIALTYFPAGDEVIEPPPSDMPRTGINGSLTWIYLVIIALALITIPIAKNKLKTGRRNTGRFRTR